MSPTVRHIPLAPPLLEGPAHPDCVACVVIPARNEQDHLRRALESLENQKDLHGDPLPATSYEVLLLLNNCTDASEAVARAVAAEHPAFRLHILTCSLAAEQAHVGTARRLLMDTACERLRGQAYLPCAILSTDADTAVAPDWVARNLLAIRDGADAVGGVIHLFPHEREELARLYPAVQESYCRDCEYQAGVARLESLLDPDAADPWPRHLHHFGASLACTPAIYSLAGGLPPVKPLEDVAFVDALRRVGARLRHCPDVHIFTSARMDGRAEVGLSGQLRHWKLDAELGRPQQVDSAAWLAHRFRTLAALRRLNEGAGRTALAQYPGQWQPLLTSLLEEQLATPRFLERLDCNRLIEETFTGLGEPRHTPIQTALSGLEREIARCESSVLSAV